MHFALCPLLKRAGGFLSALFFIWIPLFATASPECRQYWQQKGLIQKNLHVYDFEKDVSADNSVTLLDNGTPLGNTSYSSYSQRVQRQDCEKDWTVLIYMAADNDLSPFAFWDLYEMEAGFLSEKNVAASSNVKTDVIVQLDSTKSRIRRRLHMFQTPQPYDEKLDFNTFYNFQEHQIRSPIVEFVPENNEPAEKSLREFLEWGIARYPSKHYMVIVWGHGQGWTARLSPENGLGFNPLPFSNISFRETSKFRGRNFGGLAFDEADGTFLDIPSLHRTLQSVSRSSLKGKPFDIYASDACLMQMLEVALEISDTTRFVVGSSQIQNFMGLPYRRLFYELNTGKMNSQRIEAEVRAENLFGQSDEAFTVSYMIPYLMFSSLRPGGLQSRFAPDAIKTLTSSAISSYHLRQEFLPTQVSFSYQMENFLKEDPDFSRVSAVLNVMNRVPKFQGSAQEFGTFLMGLRDYLDKEILEIQKITDPTQRSLKLQTNQNLRAWIKPFKTSYRRSVFGYMVGYDYVPYLNKEGFRSGAVWLPNDPVAFQERLEDFRKSIFFKYARDPVTQKSPWERWLSKLLLNE